MHYITALYPYQEGAYFNFDYYSQNHLALLRECFGDNFIDVQVRKGLASIESETPRFICLFSMRVHSIDKWKEQIELHGGKIFSDTKNFTNLEPIIQIDSVITPISSN